MPRMRGFAADGADPPHNPRGSTRSAGSRAAVATLPPDLEVLRPLGEGSAARVHLARELPLDRLVAVKVLSRDLATDEVARARFEREASAAAALDHANAVTLHRFGYTPEGIPYLVMQYIPGVTLAERLAAEGPLPVAEARRVLGDVAAALAAAHRSGFVHRDVRPANVLCERESGRVMVTDFGLAGLLPTQDAGGTRLTRAGEALGQPGYASPEQLRGEVVSESADVYALGVMGYELLTGYGPYRGETESELGAAHLRSPPRKLALLRPDVDPDLEDLLRRCLSKDPRQRPGAAFVAARLRQQDEAPAQPGSPAGDFLDDLLRRRLPQVVAITAVVGYAALGFVDQLVDRGVFPGVAYPLALATFASSLLASGVISWFHGRAGRQRVARLEVFLLALVSGAWALTCGLILIL